MSFQLGENTLKVTPKLFAENRRRLVKELRQKAPPGSVVVLEGGKERFRYNTDFDGGESFRQESYFFWTFGVHESDCYGLIDVDSGKSILFPRRLPSDFAIWQGRIEPESWFFEKYEVDEVHFYDSNTISNTLKRLEAKKIQLLRAENTDSKKILEPAEFDGKEVFDIDTELLYPIMAELRVFKTDYELEVMRYAVKIACDAHKMVMKNIQPGYYEYQMESIFRHTSYFHGGCRYFGYTCICGSGGNAAILHYGNQNSPNSKKLYDGDICCFDMGPEYNCYCNSYACPIQEILGSDITCSFPCNGKFTDQQKTIYNIVLKANKTVFEAAKPGVRWTDMHLLAERIILSGLKDAGILTGDIDEMLEKRVGAVFMPHGLGHFVGLEIHDVGGYLGDALPRSNLSGLKYLRTTRTLQERMVVAIEPGCYFNDTLLNQALGDPVMSKYFNEEVLQEYRGVGGIRVEDNVVIWEGGNENMSADLPRTVEEIEAFMTEKDMNNNLPC